MKPRQQESYNNYYAPVMLNTTGLYIIASYYVYSQLSL